MNTIYQLLLRLYTSIRERLFPVQNQCSHCETPVLTETMTDQYAIRSLIRFEGAIVGYATNIHQIVVGVGSETHNIQEHFSADSVVFELDHLERLFLNGLAIPESQKLAFAMVVAGQTKTLYLVHSDDPVYVKEGNQDMVRLNNATMETDWP